VADISASITRPFQRWRQNHLGWPASRAFRNVGMLTVDSQELYIKSTRCKQFCCALLENHEKCGTPFSSLLPTRLAPLGSCRVVHDRVSGHFPSKPQRKRRKHEEHQSRPFSFSQRQQSPDEQSCPSDEAADPHKRGANPLHCIQSQVTVDEPALKQRAVRNAPDRVNIVLPAFQFANPFFSRIHSLHLQLS